MLSHFHPILRNDEIPRSTGFFNRKRDVDVGGFRSLVSQLVLSLFDGVAD